LKRGKLDFGSELFGNAFEHFIYNELYAHSSYSGKDYPIYYWRTASQIEIDFVLGNHDVAIEGKATSNVQSRHLKGLKSFSEEYAVNQLVLVCNEPLPRISEGVRILPWKVFLEELWSDKII
jgi:predicted AAA+ superfamily ATPase